MLLPFFAELLNRAGRHPAVEEAVTRLRQAAPVQGGSGRLAGLTDTAKALVMASIARTAGRPVAVLVESNRRAEELLAPVRFFYHALAPGGALPGAVDAVTLVPGLDVLPYQGLSPHPDILQARALGLWQLASGKASIALVPVAAARMRCYDGEYYATLSRSIERGGDLPLDTLLGFLAAVGYERHEMVESPGQFAVRGGLLDVFSPEAALPVRVELFGDTVESLREFDPETQRSVRPLERATLLPLSEFLRAPELLQQISARVAGRMFTAENEELRHAGAFPGWEFEALRARPAASHLSALDDDVVWIVDEPGQITAASEKLGEALFDNYSRLDDSTDAAPPETYFLSDAEWDAMLNARARLALEHLPMEHDGAMPLVLPSQPTARFHGDVPAFFHEVKGRIAGGERVALCASSTGEMERLADLCHDYEMPYQMGEVDKSATMARLAEDAAAGSVPALILVKAPLAEGVAFPDLQLVLHGTSDLFEAAPAERPRRRERARGVFFSDMSDLKPGDFVVHVDHGIGQYDGLRQIETDGAMGEFMLLRYADDARLYVPLARLDLVQKYRTLGEAKPALDKLGGTAWVTRKKRVRKTLVEMADKLLRLYAERKTVPGHAFLPDSNWQREFADAFEFDETPDQLRAIQDVRADMERATPMDRLLCGDVGYGKTEVAMRAAFAAVCDSKQVAVLAPTTVLAFQHYQTFRSRFAAFPARMEMLSRFRSAKEQKKILADVEAGKVDVLIGTHRLLSRDLKFHDLGLLVVDEEQRFGVAHKERLKELRKNVDVLTMSATPIPRTLHMSLVGLRDMSVIETPPKDRLAIQTVVVPFREALVQRAITEELSRGGQVYFVHNRVQSIHSLAALLQRLAPNARVVVGHGQMGEKELESVMLRFIRGEADVLVSTSIIENGLDIPRVNTILINRADRFGLSELYQLRGRVGRSSQRAYAYLLVPQDAPLSNLARRRLAALTEFSELGAGFRIAALDLELRGAGNLLGSQQHGHVNAVGFDLYVQMLERAVDELKGEAAQPELRVTLNLGLDIRIPPAYITSESMRLRMYKRIAAVSSDEEREEALRELEDRFGPAPAPVHHLLDYAVLKARCERLLVASVERRGERIAVKFHDQTPVRPENMVQLLRRQKGLRLDPSGVLWLETRQWGDGVAQAVQKVLLQLQA